MNVKFREGNLVIHLIPKSITLSALRLQTLHTTLTVTIWWSHLKKCVLRSKNFGQMVTRAI